MNLKVKDLENANCLICQSKDSNILYRFTDNKSTFNIVKCQCSFIYLNPRPISAEIYKYYSKDYLPHKKGPLFNFLQLFTYFWKKYLIKKYSSKSKNILDVGSGNASFGHYMSKHGWNIDSYDKFNEKSLSSIPEDKVYDIVTFWHSLEHFHDINEIFASLSEITNENTKFIIALPNFNSIDRKVFKHNWIALDVPRHLYHFTSSTLSKYLKAKNISIIKKRRMVQDTFFNIYLSFKQNLLIKIIFIPIISFVTLIFILLNINNSSSILYICKKDS